MIKIRAMGPRELKQVLALLERFCQEPATYSVLQTFRQLYIPVQRISRLLPPAHQFVPAIFVAVSDHKVLGLIWLSPDGHKTQRWKIDQLILDPDEFSYDVGTQLVQYVINRYGAEGVQTFLAHVDIHYEAAMGLLKSCGFRHISQLYSWQSPMANTAQQQALLARINTHSLPAGWQEATRNNRLKLQELYNHQLPPEVRLSLHKTAEDFLPRQWFKPRCYYHKCWVVPDPVRNVLLGMAELSSTDDTHFQLSVYVSQGWPDGLEIMILSGLRAAFQVTTSARITIQTYGFQQAMAQSLEAFGFTLEATAQVLVKDYWIPLSEKRLKLSSPILLFPGNTSPA